MNDSLYQISIESQAMKDKLKTQEKNLKNNYSDQLDDNTGNNNDANLFYSVTCINLDDFIVII